MYTTLMTAARITCRPRAITSQGELLAKTSRVRTSFRSRTFIGVHRSALRPHASQPGSAGRATSSWVRGQPAGRAVDGATLLASGRGAGDACPLPTERDHPRFKFG